MYTRRAVSTIVAGLIALVAILGTTVYFMSGNTLNTQKLNQPQQQENTQSQTTVMRSGSIMVTNVHSWVSSNGQTVTAFAIRGDGGSTAIDQINMRGFSVPQTNWYSCGPSCGTSTNMNTKLTPDYDPENGVNLASGMTAFTAGPISLAQGQSTIAYLTNAGSLQPIDAGNTYALQIQAGQAAAVQQVLVVSTS